MVELGPTPAQNCRFRAKLATVGRSCLKIERLRSGLARFGWQASACLPGVCTAPLSERQLRNVARLVSRPWKRPERVPSWSFLDMFRVVACGCKSLKRQILNPRRMAENGTKHIRGVIPTTRKNAQPTVRGAIFFQSWTLGRGPKTHPKRAPTPSRTAPRAAAPILSEPFRGVFGNGLGNCFSKFL